MNGLPAEKVNDCDDRSTYTDTSVEENDLWSADFNAPAAGDDMFEIDSPAAELLDEL